MNGRGCQSVGIDLGTTYSSLAYMDQQLTPRVVADTSGRTVMPSVVFFDDEEVLVGADESRIDMGFIKEVNRELGPGYKGNLRLAAETEGFSGGFILRRGKVKTNVSVDVLLNQARKELEIELAKDLFT